MLTSRESLDMKQVFYLLPPSFISMPLTDPLLQTSSKSTSLLPFPDRPWEMYPKVCKPTPCRQNCSVCSQLTIHSWVERDLLTHCLSGSSIIWERKELLPRGWSLLDINWKRHLLSPLGIRAGSWQSLPTTSHLRGFCAFVRSSLIFSKYLPSAKFRCSLRQRQNISICQSQA